MNQEPVYTRNTGLTLIEVMVGIAVFSITAISLVAGLVTTRKLSEANIYQSSALSMATSLIEQTKSLNYEEITDFVDGTTSELSFRVGDGGTTNFQNATEITGLKIPLEADSNGDATRTMDIDITLEARRFSDLDAVQIEIRYEYPVPLTQRVRRNAVSTIISDEA